MSQMLTNNQTVRVCESAVAMTDGPHATAAVSMLNVSWKVACAGVETKCGRPLASVCWGIDGSVARAAGVDVDGHEHALGEPVAVRTLRLGDLVHMDSAGGELHLTVRHEAEGGVRMLFVSTTLLERLQITGGRAEWPLLTVG
jgi:hypothetical protein